MVDQPGPGAPARRALDESAAGVQNPFRKPPTRLTTKPAYTEHGTPSRTYDYARRPVGVLFQDSDHSEPTQRAEVAGALANAGPTLVLVDGNGGEPPVLERLGRERGADYRRVPMEGGRPLVSALSSLSRSSRSPATAIRPRGRRPQLWSGSRASSCGNQPRVDLLGSGRRGLFGSGLATSAASTVFTRSTRGR